jgi:protein-tyrosine phosphatase
MIRVLFICKGNICRSPMAEAVMRHMICEAGLDEFISVDSAATGNWHVGDPPHPGTIRILKQHQIPHEDLIARQVQREDLQTFDYIVAMDEENMAALKRLGPTEKPMFRLLELVESIPDQDVPDPYYTGQFARTYELVQLGCKALLEKIVSEHNLKGAETI